MNLDIWILVDVGYSNIGMAVLLSFAKKYGSNIQNFVRLISEPSFSVGGTYLESWSFIKGKKHSLERHTNFGICIARALKGQNASKNTGETEQ